MAFDDENIGSSAVNFLSDDDLDAILETFSPEELDEIIQLFSRPVSDEDPFWDGTPEFRFRNGSFKPVYRVPASSRRRHQRSNLIVYKFNQHQAR